MKRFVPVFVVLGLVGLLALGAYASAGSQKPPSAELSAVHALSGHTQADCSACPRFSDEAGDGVCDHAATCHPGQAEGGCPSTMVNCADCPGFKDTGKDGVCDVRGQCAAHEGMQERRGAQEGRGCRFAGPCH